MNCKITPEVRNKEGQLVESKLFPQLISLTKDREIAKMIYAITKEPDFIKGHSITRMFSNDISHAMLKGSDGNYLDNSVSILSKIQHYILEDTDLYLLAESLKTLNFPIVVEDAFTDEEMSDAYMYIEDGRTIYISLDQIKQQSTSYFITGILHEVVHGYTLRAYHNDKEFRDRIDKLYKQALDLSDSPELYGFTNGKEFISEIYTNPEFRKHVQSLQDNVWINFIRKVARLIGKKSATIYERSLKLIDNVINNKGEFIIKQTNQEYKEEDYEHKISQSKQIELDENGEPTIESLAKVIDFKSLLSNEAQIAQHEKKLQANKSYSSIDEVIPKVLEFNTNNPEFVATFSRVNGKFKIKVETRNSENADKAIQLEKNNQVNNRLLALLKEMGFDVKTDSTLTSAHGVFDPNNAETTAEGLKTVIRVANSLEGKEAIAEEFAHLMIEGLANQPLVQRLLRLMNTTGIVEEILGDSFESYYKLYEGDINLLKKEAAGKILSKYLKSQDLKSMDKYSNILERLWDNIKRVFRKIGTQSIDSILKEANFNAQNLAAQIIEGSMTDKVDEKLVMDAQALYQTSRATEMLAKIANDALFNKKKRLSIYLGRSKNKEYNETDKKEIKALEEAINKGQYYAGLTGLMQFATRDMNSAMARMNKLIANYGIDMQGTTQEQMYAAKTLRNIKDFIYAYRDTINALKTLSHNAKREGVDGELDMDMIQQIENMARNVSGLMDNLTDDYEKLAKSLVLNMLKPLLNKGQSIIIPFGKNKGAEMSVDALLDKTDKDIGFINAWLDSAADSSDLIVALLDRTIKLAEAKVRDQTEDFNHALNKLHTILTQIDGVKDTKFMFETIDGVPTGYYISHIDHAKFYEAKNKFYEELVSRNLTDEQMSKEMQRWDRKNTVMSEVDPVLGRFERIPKAALYPSQALANLSPAQRRYYDAFMDMKVEQDSKLPDRHVYKYKAIQVRRDITETAISQISKPKKAVKTLLRSITDGWVRREDDDEFGSTEVDEQGNPIVNEKGKAIVNVDFSGKKVNKLPVYYTTMLNDMEMLSTDATSTLAAYGYMSTHYSEMGKIVDTLELGRDVLHQRKVGQHKGNKVMIELIKVLGEKISKEFTSGEDEISKRFDVLMEQNVYGIQKIDHGTWNVFGHEIDIAKTADNIGALTSFTTLGLNVFSGINNVLVGKYQMALEAVGGEHFNMKDVAIGDKNYYAGIASVMGELGSYKTTSKLGLITERFNVFQDFDNASKHKDYYKNTVIRVFGKGGVYFMQSAGEHYMQSRTLLAYMNHYKLKDSTGKKISLYDAYEVVKEEQNGVVVDAKLVLKQGLTKLDGTEFTAADAADITYKVAKINQSLHGIYNNADKSAIQRYALGRLAFIFRKWMVPHYNRRFKGGYYDVQMDQYKEGMYRSMWRFIQTLSKELKTGKFNYAASWNSLHDTEKANIKKAVTEMAVFFALSLTLHLLGNWKDKDTWAGRMAQYHLRRLHLEIGTSFWPPMLITDGMTIIQSPTAGMKTFEHIISAARFWDAWDIIEQGKYEGHSVYYRNNMRSIPLYNNIKKVIEIGTEDYMFNMFSNAKR